MNHSDAFTPAVVIYAGGAPAKSLSSDSAGQKNISYPVASGVLDPHRIAAEAPEKWAAFLARAYPTFGTVQQVFGVSARTEGQWRKGEIGYRAPHLIVALNDQPELAREMLVGPG